MKIIYNLSVLTIFVFCSLSCNNSNGIEQELKAWYNSVVHIPVDSMAYLSIKPYDSIYSQTDYVYIMYVDSTSCTDCAIKHLSDWSMLDASGMCDNGRLKYLFIIAPKHNQYNHIFEMVREDSCFNNFIFIDTLNVFEQANPNLPKNKLLHTFMINKAGRVMLVGNPITNSQIGLMLSDILNSSVNQQ